jgi:glycosyltransferase involved in cell wall biosynthesis
MLTAPPSARFAVVSTCPDPWGGSEELWWHAACALRARGHGVDVLKTVVDEGHPRIRHLRELSCGVRDLDRFGPRRAWDALGFLVPARWTLDNMRRQMLVAGGFLKAWRPDLVIVSQGQNLDGIHLARLCRTLGLDYVLVSQKAADFHWPPDDARAYAARAYRFARHAFFVSEHNRELTEEQLGTRLRNAVVLRNPVGVDTAGPLPWPEPDDGELRLACVGRLNVMEKGHDLLLRVLAREHWRERPVTVSVHGEGPNREGLMSLQRTLGVERVAFEGRSADIEQVWRDHHVLVLPSRAEGLPLALVEAMMCGRPAVVTDVGGAREVVEDGLTGFVAAAATVDDLDAALERMWERRPDLLRMGAAAAAHIRELVPADPGAVLADYALGAIEDSRSGVMAW